MIVLYSAPPASAPEPRLTARSMLSLGTEDFLAFWIASYSVGLPATSPPPIRAATSMFLISLANILPRRASMTAFLCLVVAHLEWPDMLPLLQCGGRAVSRPSIRSRNSRWMRPSPSTSGWNEVAISDPCRTATILPAAPSGAPASSIRASTSTSGPASSTQGARMNTACTGSSRPAKVTWPSKESTWRPNALRRTVMWSPPSVSWSGVPSSIRSASMIMPAQVPKTGRPSLIRWRIGSDKAQGRAGLKQGEGAGDFKQGRRLAPGDDQPVTRVELGHASYAGRGGAQRLEHPEVLTHVALEGEDSDTGVRHGQILGRERGGRSSAGGDCQPRSASRCGSGISSTLMPTMASPRPRLTLATTSGPS